MTDFKKPMLATDFLDDAIEAFFKKGGYLLAMPKIDGVRGMVINSQLQGRSRKPPANIHTKILFQSWLLEGFDGEIYNADYNINDESLCRLTTSPLSTIKGSPKMKMVVFDDLTRPDLGYEDRLNCARIRIKKLNENYPDVPVEIIQDVIQVTSLDRIYKLYEKFLEAGYEGIILRDPLAVHKNGRSTALQCGYLRKKPIADRDAVVIEIVEAEENLNQATIDANGRTQRSSHKDNKIGKGMVGSLIVRDSRYPKPFKIGAGRMTHEERTDYYNNPEKLIGKFVKYRSMDYGIKDVPRQGRFYSVRDEFDVPVEE